MGCTELILSEAEANQGPDNPGPMAESSPGWQFPGFPSRQANGGATATVTMSDGRTVPFTAVGTDPEDDLAVVKAENVSGLTPITLGSSKDLKVGQNVVAAGLPRGAMITKLDDTVIDGPDALIAAVRSKAPGDNVTLTYHDPSGASHTAQVTLGQLQS